jgi:alpha-L-rhamnosidase
MIRFIFMLVLLCQTIFGQIDAGWITHPDASATGFGVYHFRKTFSLGSKPNAALIKVSADNRYRLFVNGESVCVGPQRGDVAHWRYETIDIAPYLKEGKNILAAQVHNAGPDYPVAQASNRTGFILQAADLGIQTDTEWKVLQNKAYDAITYDEMKWWEWAHGWYACGFTDQVNAEDYPWGWEQVDFEDSGWKNAALTSGQWQLEERHIPLLVQKQERFKAVRRTNGIMVESAFLNGTAPFTIPGNTTVSILLDMGQESVGFPELWLSGGKDARIKITYAESLFDENGEKGDRNAVEGKTIQGYWDIYDADGGENRLFRPLWLRTFRYIQLDIRTRTEALILNDYYNIFTAYPFEHKASFASDDPSLKSIWDVAWRTMRCCALETYTDCPYYEQLNYPGDTRLQAYCSLYLTGDDRLMRDAIRLMSYSQMENGLTQACYPIRKGREIKIPTYALFWISILHDYYWLRTDDDFLEPYLPIVRVILDWFEEHVDDTGLLYGLEMWNFVDWSFPDGTPNGAERDKEGHSGFVSLQFAYTLDQAADLMSHFGYNEEADAYRSQSRKLIQAVYERCYDNQRQLFADSPLKNNYSQHSNIFAILTNALPEPAQPALMQRILDDSSLIQCSTYFSFYLFKAMQQTGKADQFLTHLTLWYTMLDQGLTTFGESGGAHDRSDCHAWSAHPAYFYLSLVCGILPAEPGFDKVIIQPSLGKLNEISCTMPHVKGDIRIDLKRTQEDGLDGSIVLPEGVSGTFLWNGKSTALKSGTTTLGAASHGGDVPDRMQLGQNYPNPFNLSTTITYALPESSDIRLDIYNLNGSLTQTLVDANVVDGTHTVVWHGENNRGIEVASGIYFYCLKAGDFFDAKRMMLIR